MKEDVIGAKAGSLVALATLVASREGGILLSAGAAVTSPLADWTLSSETRTSNRKFDEFVTEEMLLKLRPGYLGSASPADPLVSPALADLAGLPPVLVLVGSDETLLDDATPD